MKSPLPDLAPCCSQTAFSEEAPYSYGDEAPAEGGSPFGYSGAEPDQARQPDAFGLGAREGGGAPHSRQASTGRALYRVLSFLISPLYFLAMARLH
jgi:hypothetical protein